MSDEIRPRPAFAEALGDWFVAEMSERRAAQVLTDPSIVSDDLEPVTVGDLSEPDHRRRPWLLMTSAALVIGALAAVVIVVSRPGTTTDDTTSLSDPAARATRPVPEVDIANAQPLPFAGQAVGPGRYSTPLLGVPVSLTIDDDWTITEAGASSVALHNATDDGEIDVATLRWIFLTRLGGWNTPSQAIDPSFRMTGSIEPDDIDRWLGQNDVVVLDRRDTLIDGRPAIVVDLQVDPDATGAALDFPRDPDNLYNDSCGPATEPCLWYRSIASESDHGRGPRPDPVMHTGQTRRMWLIPVPGLEPILIEAVAPVGDERWLDEFETTTITSLDLGGDAPPLTSG